MIWAILGGIFVIVIIGLVSILREIHSLNQDVEFLIEFINKLTDYTNSFGMDHSIYDWLIENSIKTQKLLGGWGIIIDKPAGSFTYIPNIPIIVQYLPELREALQTKSSEVVYYYSQLRESVLRYKGVIQEQTETLHRRLKNPFIWLFTGVSFIISLPFILLYWVGLISDSGMTKIRRHWIIRLISAMVGIIGLISSLITIIGEWDKVISFLGNL